METMIGEKIKNIRKKLGLTQEDLAGENLSRGMISLIERNQTTPTIRTLNHIAPKLGISVSELLEDTHQSDIPLKNEENIILKKVIEMSKALITKKRLDEAQDALSKVYSDLTVFDVSNHGEILKLLGDINFYKENYKTAISYYNEALVYITPHETADYLQIYLNLSESNRHIQDYQTSIESAQYALLVLNSNLRENLNPLLNIKLLYNLAYSYSRISQFKLSLNTIKKTILLMQNEKISFSIGSIYMLKGLCELYLGYYNEGIDSNKKALEHLDKHSENKEIVGCHINLGILYRKNKNLSDSIKFLQRSLVMSKKLNEPWYYFNNLYELTLTYYNMGCLNETEKNIKKIMECNENRLKCKALILRGVLHHDKQQFSQALIYFDEAYNISILLGDVQLISKSLFEKAKTLNQIGNLSSSNQLLIQANQLLSTFNFDL